MGKLSAVGPAAVVMMMSFGSIDARAVLMGEPARAIDVSTVEIAIEHRASSGFDEAYRTIRGTCSAVVVGTEPLTLLTAAHCFKDVAQEGDSGLPAVRIHNADSAVTIARVKAAVVTPYREVGRNYARDLAVLVFDRAAPAGWRAARVAVGSRPRSVYICGFGAPTAAAPSAEPRCATRELATNLMDITSFLPASYAASDPQLYQRFRAQFEDKLGSVATIASLVGVNRLRDEQYAFELPIPRRGDSGGPWFAGEDVGARRVLALTSVIETFYNSNTSWPVFKRKLASDDLPYAAYGIRLDTPEAREIIARGRAAGGQIKSE